MNRSYVGAVALGLMFATAQPVFAQATGTLVFDAQPFTSEVDLKAPLPTT